MNKTISSSMLSVEINPHGAEISSITDKNGIEYMWCGDKNVWAGRAPILFPIVGALVNGKYTVDGQNYFLKQHGLARIMDFEVISESQTGLSFRLFPTLESFASYPFKFELTVNYLLNDNALSVEYVVKNNDTQTMPFSIGAHPGFALSWGKKDDIEDYYLKFSQNETADTIRLNSSHLLSKETERVLNNENIIPIKKDMFNRDALIFDGLKSDSVSLCSKKHQSSVTIEFPGFPFLGIWAKPGAPFVCIEPWYGHVDPEDHNGIFNDKPGIIKLFSNDQFSCKHRIIINS